MQVSELDPEILHNLSERYPKLLHHIEEQDPKIYKDGTAYCCLSGPNPTEGIFGGGLTEEEALEDWEKAWQKKNTGT